MCVCVNGRDVLRNIDYRIINQTVSFAGNHVDQKSNFEDIFIVLTRTFHQ